jgi:hypothetical protein
MIKQVAFVISLVSMAGAASAQTTLPDPWTRVPALPTTCYRDLAFETATGELLTQNSDAHTKQRELNIDVQAEFGKMDMQERMQRTQAFMMKDPQAAMKMMQEQQATATAMRSDITGSAEAKERLEKEFERTQAAWTEEFDKAAEPWRARRKVLAETKVRLNGMLHEWTTREAEAEYTGLIDKENAEYETRCASYYGPNGTVQTWMATYRREVIEPMADATAAQDRFIEQQMKMMDFRPGAFRTDAPYSAVRDYLTKMREVYAMRRHKLTKVLDMKLRGESSRSDG